MLHDFLPQINVTSDLLRFVLRFGKYTVTTFKIYGFLNIRTGILDYLRERFQWLAWPLDDIGFMEAW